MPVNPNEPPVMRAMRAPLDELVPDQSRSTPGGDLVSAITKAEDVAGVHSRPLRGPPGHPQTEGPWRPRTRASWYRCSIRRRRRERLPLTAPPDQTAMGPGSTGVLRPGAGA